MMSTSPEASSESHAASAAGEPDRFAACDRVLAWIERARDADERRRAMDDAVAEPLHLYAASLLRMRVRPALDPAWLDTDPVHVSLFGGTNSGKSTLLNLLLGRSAAGMNVTARFSQHPEAYQLASLGDAWLTNFPSRFEGYRRYDDQHPPRQDDADLEANGYRPAFARLDPNHVCAGADASPATTTAVFWDVPDFSTEEARYWMSAVLDAVALADVILLAVTDESYADARVATLLAMVSRADARIHVVVNKVAGGAALLADIRAKLESDVPADRFHAVPFVREGNPESRVAALLRTDEAAAFRRAVAEETRDGLERKRTALAGAVRFLEERFDALLAPLSAEAEAAARWEAIVETVTRDEFLDRYRSDYLNGERYGDFNQTLVRLMDRLEVPGVGELVRALRDVVRLPLHTLTRFVRRVVRGPKAAPPKPSPEHEVVAARFDAWLATLRAKCEDLAERDGHPMWTKIARDLGSAECIDRLASALETGYGEYRPKIEAEIRERAEEIYRAISEKPVLLNTLRGANLAVDTAAIVLVVKSGGINWSDAILGPAVAGVRRTLFEAGMEQYLRHQEARLKESQFRAIEAIALEHLRAPVRDLFHAEFDREDIRRASEDFALVAASARRVAKGGQP